MANKYGKQLASLIVLLIFSPLIAFIIYLVIFVCQTPTGETHADVYAIRGYDNSTGYYIASNEHGTIEIDVNLYDINLEEDSPTLITVEYDSTNNIVDAWNGGDLP